MTEMNDRTTLLALLAALVVVVAGVPAVGGSAPRAQQGADTSNATAGERLAGAFAVHGTELSGEVEQRALSVSLNRTTDATARASVLSSQVSTVQIRLATLERRQEQLATVHERGEISDHAYRVRAAQLAAQVRVLSTLVENTEQAAARLPESIREGRGLDETTFDSLRNRTARLRENITTDVDLGTDWNRTATFDNRTVDTNLTATPITTPDTSLEFRVEHVNTSVELVRTNVSRVEQYVDDDELVAQEALACARDHVAAAAEEVDRARTAAEQGNETAVEDALAQAERELERARGCLREAREYARDDSTYTATPTESDSTHSTDDYNRTYTKG